MAVTPGFLRAETAEPVVRAADEADQVVDQARSTGAAGRSASMPSAAVQMMAGAHRRGRLLGEPVRRDVGVLARRRGRCPAASTRTGPPGAGCGSRWRRRRSAARPPGTLRAAGRTARRVRTCSVVSASAAASAPSASAARGGGGELVQVRQRAVAVQDVRGRGLVQPQRVLGGGGGGWRARQRHARGPKARARRSRCRRRPWLTRDQDPGRRRGVGHADLGPGDNAVAAMWPRAGTRGRLRRLPDGRGEERRRRRRPRRAGPAAGRGCPHRVTGSTPIASVASAGHRRRGPAGLGQQHRGLGHAEPLAAQPAGHGQPQQAGLGEFLPQGAVAAVVLARGKAVMARSRARAAAGPACLLRPARLSRLARPPRQGGRLAAGVPAQHVGGGLGGCLLGLSHGEVHGSARLLPGQAEGRSATTDSRIWLVPPAMLRHRLSRKACTAPAAGPSVAAPSGPQSTSAVSATACRCATPTSLRTAAWGVVGARQLGQGGAQVQSATRRARWRRPRRPAAATAGSAA